MASHPHGFGMASALPLAAALAIIPSLPRPMLSRLVARAIERLDDMDGDTDLEPDDHAEDDGPGAGVMDGNAKATALIEVSPFSSDHCGRPAAVYVFVRKGATS